MNSYTGMQEIPFDEEEIDQYKNRVIDAIKEKIAKAQKDYDTENYLILAIYINEYISIHMDDEDWESFIKEHEKLFDNVEPFSEIVFWNLPYEKAISVRSNAKKKMLLQ